MEERDPQEFDVEAIRRQFPILERRIHDRPLCYLDNAATAQLPRAVLDAVTEHEILHRANSTHNAHQLALEASRAFEGARGKVAAYLNVAADEVVFTYGTTSSLNLAARCIGAALQAGDEVLISRAEHHSNIVPWQMLRDARGVRLKVLPVTEDGRLDLDRLEELVTPRTRLLALTHASNVTGAITDVARLRNAAKAVGAPILLDGAQRVPHAPLDLAELGVDFYAFSGHKMYAPNGIGVFWGKREHLERMPPFLGGGHMIDRVWMDRTDFAGPPQRFEAGTPPIAQAVGLGAAVDWIMGLDRAGMAVHISRLTQRLLDGMAELRAAHGRLRLIGPASLRARLPVLSFTVDGLEAEEVCAAMDARGVALRGGHHCAQPLADFFGVKGTARASLAAYNDDGDVDTFLNALEKLLKDLK